MFPGAACGTKGCSCSLMSHRLHHTRDHLSSGRRANATSHAHPNPAAPSEYRPATGWSIQVAATIRATPTTAKTTATRRKRLG